MHYVLVEDNRVISILSYEPTVPPSVGVYPIANDVYVSLTAGTHYFDLDAKEVKEIPKEVAQHQLKLKAKTDKRGYLAETDWMVLRHIREQALGFKTTLSQEQYIELETERHNVATSIKK